MALNEVLLLEEKKEGLEIEDEPYKILDNISSLSVYKLKELRFTQDNKIGMEAMNTLILMVGNWVYNNEKVSVHRLLVMHSFSIGYYHAIYRRLTNLNKRGLVECEKVKSYNGYASYFYPTEKGIEGVLGLLVK